MQIARLTTLAGALLATGLLLPQATAQMSHAQAKARVEAHDKKTHNKLKTEGIPTAGGAVGGGIVAGPPGAFAGAKMGHTIGSVFHGVKKHEDIKHEEKHGTIHHRRARVVRTRTAVHHHTGE